VEDGEFLKKEQKRKGEREKVVSCQGIIGEFLTLDFALSLRGVLRINYHKL